MSSQCAMDPETEQLAAQAHEAAEALFGPGVTDHVGVTHVSATVRTPDGRLHVIAIGESAPRSASDFFALNLARARADAILTSAENIRREPTLSHQLAGPAARALAALRTSLGKIQPPACAILSLSGDLPLAHPVWNDGTRKLVLTSAATWARLADHLGERAEVIGLPDLTPRSAVAWLRTRAGTIEVEAGPSTAGQLYDEPSLVTELLLSRFEGELAESALGRPLPSESTLLHGLSCVHEVRREEASGPWVFQRWLRKS